MNGNIHADYFKWWCGTVIVGEIPIIIRLISFMIIKKDIELFNITELVCFGFAIQISSIYFGIGKPSFQSENKFIVNTTFSIIFIVIFSTIYIISMLAEELLDLTFTKILVIITCLISRYIGQNSVQCAIINNDILTKE